jgi:heterotetrameric sarcosine oxidase gamma subunit
VFERRSVLAQVLRAGGRDGSAGERLLRLGEVRGRQLVQIAAFPATLGELQRVLQACVAGALPPRIGEVQLAGTRRILKTAPEQYWIMATDGDDLVGELQAAVPPDIGALTPLSHSRSCILVEGSKARELLAKGIALDLHPDVFRRGQFALSALHHTTVLIHRSDTDRYEVHAMRTFAVSVWEWMIDAALPYGYEVLDTPANG